MIVTFFFSFHVLCSGVQKVSTSNININVEDQSNSLTQCPAYVEAGAWAEIKAEYKTQL